MDRAEKIWSVSELNSAVREILENSFHPFWLKAEIGTLNLHRSGHVYLTLKDERTQVKAVFFGGAELARKFKIQPGTEIEVLGNISVYEVRGEYQFSIKNMRPLGLGDLQRRFEELKNKLAAEGLFDEERKKPIPMLPRKIGIVTSPDGAAIRDFLQIINRRFPNVNIKIYPAPVQGKGAERKLAAGIEFFNQLCPVDVMVITRGGGSMEDLWPFNEEILARAIAKSDIPVISAVGHEIDFTICDFVSDMRVPTPSAAAELVAGKEDEFKNSLDYHKKRMLNSIELRYHKLARRYEAAAKSYVFREPAHLIKEKQQYLDELHKTMEDALKEKTSRFSSRTAVLAGRLNSMNPLAVLNRGYSILTDKSTGKPLDGPAVQPGTKLRTYMAGGILDSVAERGENMDFKEILLDFNSNKQ